LSLATPPGTVKNTMHPNGMPAPLVLPNSRCDRLLASFQDASPFWEVPVVSLRSTTVNFPDSGTIAEEHEYLVETIAFGDPAAAEDAARTHIEAVWLRIAEQESSNSDAESSPLKRATVHIAFRLHCPLTLSHVANKIAFTSPGNLSRLFRRHHGVSFQVYLQKLRMKKAAELLRTTRLPVARIAKRVGYNDASRFGQHFKRQLEATPIAYRIAGQS
jgi:YesN/AraC family two-component response regulator